MSAKGKALNNNGYDQKNEPTIFLPSRVHTKPQPKTTVVTRWDPNKGGNRKRTETEWLVLGLGWG